MDDGPGGKNVTCPECGEMVIAVVPRRSELVDDEADADGKVWANCRNCEERFLVYFTRP